ncbi:MAG: kynureninase [Solirubrobacteraceae bacterium]|nr:kynureninase [Solirubrobacteraceae bacterium]
MAGLTRADAEALDVADPLAGFRERLEIAGDVLYADGNSLGRPPVVTRERLAALHDDWATWLVAGWADWIELPLAVGDALARGVLGARPGEVVACDSVTVNLFKLATAALDANAGAVVSDRDNFPTDRYVLAGVAERAGRRYIELDEPSAEALRDVGEDVALASFSHVAYRSGALADLPAITATAHERGALVLWDLSHSAGAVEVGLQDAGADLAVGCTYKYLDGGPGAPAFLYVREDLQPQLRSPIQGWFGQRDQFAMGPAYEPEPGIARWLAGTPPIAGLVAVEAGVELVAEAGIKRIAAKAQALTEHAIALHDAWLEPLGFTLLTPRDPARRGAHVALAHPEGWRICRALIELAGVLPDFREPDVVRYGFSPLETRFADVFDALERTRNLVVAGEHLRMDAARRRVT